MDLSKKSFKSTRLTQCKHGLILQVITFKISTLSFIFLALLLFGCKKQRRDYSESLSDALYGFNTIQDSARTKVWWFHGETETAKEGITADLVAFKNAGIGGVVYYDQSHGKAENALPGFSREWWEMLRFSAEEAERLGLTFELHVSNGFVAGGPWITDEISMKRLAASERIVQGGNYFEGFLDPPVNRHNFYKDVAVLAFPVHEATASSRDEKVTVTSNLSGLDTSNLFNSQPGSYTWIPVVEGENVYIDITFEEEFTARSISYEVRPQGKATTSATNIPEPPADTFVGTGYRILPNLGQLEVSSDGKKYTKVCDLKPIYRAHENWRQKTISFNAVKGRYYRLNFHDWWDEQMFNPNLQIGAVVLNSLAKLDQWEEKAGLFSEYMEQDKTPEYTPAEAIDHEKIINISDKMDKNGILRWNIPEGNWMIMRFAYVPTGGSTKHGRKNLMGKECDKLSAHAVSVQWENYVEKIIDSLQATNSGLVSGVVMDSHEAGAQNWTDDFIEQFTQRQGYDPTLYLPTMMGYIINGVKESDGFLFDVRRNIADMISDNYYGTVEKLCKERGLVFTAQAIGNALCIVGDPIQAKSKVSKPQGEFWCIHPDGNYDIKESSSAAHLYGKQIASAEAFTDTKYSASLADLKSLADYAYTFGINEFVICASPYQPWLDKIPGSTGGGRHYAINRNNTWWSYSRPFWDFQARSAYIMRQGKPSIDLCVYLGENAPVKILTYRLPDIPGGFDFDAFTSHALFTRMDAKDGRITLPDGTGYSMMILPRNGDITLDALRKIHSIVKKGAKIYGPKPLRSKSKKDINQYTEYEQLANQLWGGKPGSSGMNQYGKGEVYWGMTLSQAINKASIIPDIQLETGDTKQSMIYFAHRSLKDADIYYLDNHKDEEEHNTFTFASSGKHAQLWNAATGERYSLPILRSDEQTVSIDLYLHPRESYFVVITDKEEALPAVTWLPLSEQSENKIEGGWHIHFDRQLGGVGDIYFDELLDWTNHSDPRVKYYSGTAVYKKEISTPPGEDRIYLYTGDPGFVARVYVNANDAGVVWCSPWILDITDYVKDGENSLEIHVANSLLNRMIYDASLKEEDRVTYSYPAIVSADDPLEPSGLKQAKLILK